MHKGPQSSGMRPITVTDGDDNNILVSEVFHQHTGVNDTITAAISPGDTVISVTDGSQFSVNDFIEIGHMGSIEQGFPKITVIATNDLTLDRPLDHNHPIGEHIITVLENMNVNGSLGSPSVFMIKPLSSEVWHIYRLNLHMADGTAMDDGTFGGIGALTNGVQVRLNDEDGTLHLALWKSNADIALDIYDVTYADKAPAGEFGFRGRWTFKKSNTVLKLDGRLGDSIECRIQDNLTELLEFKVKVQGHVSVVEGD